MGAKKRRRNNGRKNKRKNLNDNRERYRKDVPFGNLAMKNMWDYSKTVNQNYETMGLLGGNLNVLPRRVPKTDGTRPTPPPLGPESVKKPTKKIIFVSGVDAANMPSLREQLDARACGESSRGAFHMTIDEIAYLEPLIEKYENNWNGMFKDNKKNYKQMTREKLQRRCERLCKLREQELIMELEEEEEEEEEGESEEEESEESSD